jgi:hypothetical protein
MKRPLARAAALTFGSSSSPLSNLVICSAKTFKNIELPLLALNDYLDLQQKHILVEPMHAIKVNNIPTSNLSTGGGILNLQLCIAF